MRRASLAALLFAIGCDDFTLVGPQPIDHASLDVFVRVTVHDSVTVDLFAGFRTGPGTAPPSTLSVRGTAVQPTVQGQEFWIYEWHEVFPSSSAPSQLQVTTPIVQGSSSSALPLVIPIARREDPMDVTVAFGDDLRLHVSPLVTPPPPLTGGAVHWAVILQQAPAVNAGQVFVSGNDAYPPELQFPWEWVHAVSQDSLLGRFQATVGYHAASAAYAVNVNAVSDLTWRIHISPKAQP
jgi:hypothetical protein